MSLKNVPIQSIFVQIFLVGSVIFIYFSKSRSRSSKVIDFGTNRKRVCEFLLVRHSNRACPILHRFGDIAGFCVPDPTPISP